MKATICSVPQVRKGLIGHRAFAILAFMEHVTEKQKPVFAKHEPVLPVAPVLVVTTSEQRLTDDAEVEPEWRATGSGVIPEGRFTNKPVADNAGALGHRVVAVRVDQTPAGGAVGRFVDRFHSPVRPFLATRFKSLFSVFIKELMRKKNPSVSQTDGFPGLRNDSAMTTLETKPMGSRLRPTATSWRRRR